jgi:hypothetical protein
LAIFGGEWLAILSSTFTNIEINPGSQKGRLQSQYGQLGEELHQLNNEPDLAAMIKEGQLRWVVTF